MNYRRTFTKNGGNRYGKSARTKTEKHTAAFQFLMLKDRITGDEVDTLKRSYGLSEADAVKLFEEVAAKKEQALRDAGFKR